MILFDFVFGFPFQLAGCLAGFASSIYGLHLSRGLSASDQKLPNLLRLVVCACFFVASLRLIIILLPQTSGDWKIAYIVLSITRIGLVNFGTALATVISIYMAYICSSDSFEQSIHSISYSVLMFFAIVPLLARVIQNIAFTDFGITFDHIRLKPNFLSDDHTQNQYICYVIAAIVILYYMAGLLSLLILTWKLFKKVRTPGKASYLKKWRLSCNLASYFFLIIIAPLTRQISVSIVEYWFRDDVDQMNFLSFLLLLAVPTSVTDSIGLFMILALIRCRNIYASSIDAGAKIVLVEHAAEYAGPLESTTPSQPPRLEREKPHYFRDHTTHDMQEIDFLNERPPTESQLSNMFSKMAEMPVFDFADAELF